MKQIMTFLTLKSKLMSARESIKVLAGTLIPPEEISITASAYDAGSTPLFMRDPAKLNEPEVRRPRRRKS